MNNIDFVLILFSAMLHASWNFFTKRSEANKIAVLWFGWVIAGVCALPFALIFTNLGDFQASWIPYLILTGLVHAGYLYTLGLSYNVGEMSLIYPISRGLAIFFTISFMLIFQIESISAQGALGVIFLILGIGLVAIKRVRDLERRAIMILGTKVGAFVSLYSIIDKMSVQHIPPLFYITSMFIITAVILYPVIMKRLKSQSHTVMRHYRIYSGMIGIVSFLTYYLVLIAMQSSPASYVVALREVSIVFGSILGMWLLKEESNRRKILGIFIIAVGAYIIKTS